MTITVRRLVEDNKLIWRELCQGFLMYYGSKLNDDVPELTWSRLMDMDFGIHGLGAVDADGNLVGFAHYLFHPVTCSKDPRCYLENLFTAEAARNTGAGRALIEAVADAARTKGADQLYWLTEDHNRRAHYLYDKVANKSKRLVNPTLRAWFCCAIVSTYC